MKTQDLLRWFKRNRYPAAAGLAAAVLLVAGLVLWADRTCEQAATGRVYRSIDSVPEREVGLVLGTSKSTRHGRPNLHFNQRIDAAVALYRAGKVHHLLVSGDNHVATYDEPTDMRNALVAAGIPTNAITCDYAGFRTLDSVVRAKRSLACRNARLFPRNSIVLAPSGLRNGTVWMRSPLLHRTLV